MTDPFIKRLGLEAELQVSDSECTEGTGCQEGETEMFLFILPSYIVPVCLYRAILAV